MYRVLLCFLLFSITLLHAKILNIDSNPNYQTKNYFTFTLSNEKNETFKELMQRNWEDDTSSLNTIKNANHAYWAKLEIKNSSRYDRSYYLKAENQFTYHIEFFLYKNQKKIDYIEDGVISKNKNRSFNVNHMIFPLKLEANKHYTILFKIKNYNKVNIDFLLLTESYLLDYYQTYNLLEGLFFGGMIIMLLYNLFLFFLLKFSAYLYYVFYSMGLIIYYIGLFGYSQRYFPETTWIFYISSGLAYIFMTLFVKSILNLKEKLPNINKILNIFILFFIIAICGNILALEAKLFFYAQLLFNLFFILIPLYIILVISSTYYMAYKQKDSIARFYSLIWTIVAIVGILLPLINLNLIKTDIPSSYIFQILILFEALSFSFILSYKIKLIEKEKREQEKFLVKQNKLASMGEMISVIAHQWRQPLSEINGVILSMDIDYKKNKLNTHVFNRHLDDLEKTTAYMSKTIHDFMDYFNQNRRVEEFLISDIIQNAINLLTMSNHPNINIEYKGNKYLKILTRKSELIQALLIVLNNAIDACESNQKEHSLISITEHTKENKLYINITDNGVGISSNIIDKIYNPYFTTKHASKGIGLGLYILKMIIEQNLQGNIEIKSSNKGTIVTLSIPIS